MNNENKTGKVFIEQSSLMFVAVIFFGEVIVALLYQIKQKRKGVPKALLRESRC